MHTAGPWVASDHHSGIGWRIETDAPGYHNDGWIIASEMLGPDAADNARVMAAAPELLEALEAVCSAAAKRAAWGRDNVPAMRDEQSALSSARAVIAKATGAGA